MNNISMKHSIKRGFSFGLTSGIITTLGLIVGLNSGTHSKIVVIGGILIIAIADALSDAMGMHLSEESQNQYTDREIWEATISTFLAKLVFASTFIIPFMLFKLQLAVILSIIWGLLLISIFSYYIAKNEKRKPYKVILEHLILTIFVVIATNFIGDWISSWK
jgi:VIT1/CCC1 family predicted Fe2+/Mn2+ transporter